MRCVEIFPLLGRMQTTPQFAGAHAAGAHICLGTVIFHRRTSSLTRLLQEGKAQYPVHRRVRQDPTLVQERVLCYTLGPNTAAGR